MGKAVQSVRILSGIYLCVKKARNRSQFYRATIEFESENDTIGRQVEVIHTNESWSLVLVTPLNEIYESFIAWYFVVIIYRL